MAGPTSVEEYLSQIPPEARAALERVRETIRAAAPDTVETISYQMPTFKYQGKALIGYAAFKKHCSVFPYSTKVMEVLRQELEDYDTSGQGATIRFTVEEPLPDELIHKLIATRIAEIEGR